MGKIILALLVTIGLNANPYYKEIQKLSIKQIETLHEVFKAAKLYDLQWTITAIAWKESLAGVVPLRVNDRGKWPACGVTGIMLKSYFQRHKEIPVNKFNISKVCWQITTSIPFSVKESAAEINYWRSKFRCQWFKIWAAYNAGWNYNSKKGRAYAKDLYLRIRALRRYFKKWDNE